ncbi:unnamed protein product, partial [marine sediment metagenome]
YPMQYPLLQALIVSMKQPELLEFYTYLISIYALDTYTNE